MLIKTSRPLTLMLWGLLPALAWAQPALDSPYGVMALWLASDAVTKAVLLLLLLMSLGSWYILLRKAMALRSMDGHYRAAIESFWKADTVERGMALLDARSPLRFIASSALEAAKPQLGLLTHVAPEEWISMQMQRAVEVVQRDLQSGLAFLATVGSVSPFVGLFGTVWGIYHALTAIGISGQASIDKVAGPVGEALIMTALGLAVAVPAVLAYNWLLSRNKLAMADVRAFANDLHAVVAGSRNSA
jgi:biopolymer transport protein ExbB